MAAVLAVGLVIFGLTTVGLSLGTVNLRYFPPFAPWSALIISLMRAATLTCGSYLLRGQTGRHTLILLVVWLVAGATLHLPLADPKTHLFYDLAIGSSAAIILTFAAARPLYVADGLQEGWPARLRYYGGAFLFAIGTTHLFLFIEFLIGWVTGTGTTPTRGTGLF